MTGRDQRSEAMRHYRHTLDEVAENRVVATAEGIITAGWVVELERARRGVLNSAGEPDADRDRILLVLEAMDAELERVCRVAADRESRRQADLSRLRTAWCAAHGG